ncbi:MAG: PilZ domain-containing protein [Alphaproteobacteria bacterium]|nr:PilZ domain-containing protein [Alphaproteobacteria bacterium]
MLTAQKIVEIGNATDRRAHDRHDTCWWGALAFGTLSRECYVYNVSLGGAKLLVVGPYEARDRLKLMLPSFGLFRCNLRWTDGPFIGVKFDERDHDRTAALVAHALTAQPLTELPSVAEFIGL